ncbi:uncharacterized protein LOC129300157 [Prosopis cineraria]|uniref:uncharacterized protein LOC129300157 n=1 Tax=Prosopis cineraria TaxID=364024 RepID=UPI00240FA9B2|nr:uncharacterized protein LOC129300157 [Prosopis cineraria]
MASPGEFLVVVAYAPLAVIALMLTGESVARELRPSDHGLVFQDSPPSASGGVNYPPEMMSFFNGQNSSSESSTSSGMALPKAMNTSDSPSSSWWTGDAGGGRHRDHVRDALIVASLVCGVTGVVILAASGLLYLLRYRKNKFSETTTCENNNNKLELAIRNS